jgi:chromosomal replication initiator protein
MTVTSASTGDLWQAALGRLSSKVSPQNFDMWLRPIECVGQDGAVLHLRAPNSYVRLWFESNYLETVLDEIRAATGVPYRVELSVTPSEARRDPTPAPPVPEPTPAVTTVSSAEDADLSSFPPDVGNLNPRYTFETFVAGPSNQLAFAASQAAASAYPPKYNPVFICGGVGLGKTHLLHAIGRTQLALRPNARIVYISSERFMNEYVNAIRGGKMHDFRTRYREGIDVLLVDDVQFLAGKDGTQDEFFHTFNALHDAQKQIVVTSDALPKEIPTLEERLRSRFEGGLIADIQPPDLEMKVAILRKKAAAEKADIPDDVSLFIAGTVKSNIRELEGRLNRVLAFSSLTGKPVSVELAKETLRDILGNEENRAIPSEILKTVALHYGLRVSDLKAKTNAKPIAFPRQVAMFLCRRLTGLSYPEIGRLFNDKHHSTVMHSVEKIEKMIEDDPDFRKVIEGFQQPYR